MLRAAAAIISGAGKPQGGQAEAAVSLTLHEAFVRARGLRNRAGSDASEPIVRRLI